MWKDVEVVAAAAAAPSPASRTTLAKKLKGLIDFHRDPTTGGPLSITETAESANRLYLERQIHATRSAMRQQGASQEEMERAEREIRAEKAPLNRQYLSNLVNGHRTNPSKAVLEALACHFDVDASYFFDGDTEESRQTADEITLGAGLRALLEKAREAGGGTDDGSGQDVVALMRGAPDLSPEAAASVVPAIASVLKVALMASQRPPK